MLELHPNFSPCICLYLYLPCPLLKLLASIFLCLTDGGPSLRGNWRLLIEIAAILLGGHLKRPCPADRVAEVPRHFLVSLRGFVIQLRLTRDQDVDLDSVMIVALLVTCPSARD